MSTNIIYKIEKIIDEELNKSKFYPKIDQIFNAINNIELSKLKAVIIGQDPYHNGSAHGYSFSVLPSRQIPASLQNIFKELKTEYNISTLPSSGCLLPWTDEGVLLLNTILTVEPSKPKSHANIGWQDFTNAIIQYIDNNYKVVFLAWGNNAQKTCNIVHNNPVIKSGHPSPLNTSKPFVGCNCFKECNNELIKMGILPIRWNVLWI